MEHFNFLKVSPYYKNIIKSHSFHFYTYDDGKEKIIAIDIPTNSNNELFFQYGNETDFTKMPVWFQEMIKKAYETLDKRDKIRKLFGNRYHFNITADPSVKIDEISIPQTILPRLNPTFSIFDDKDFTTSKIKSFKAKLSIDNKKTYSITLSDSRYIGIHPLAASGLTADFDDNLPEIQLIKQ